MSNHLSYQFANPLSQEPSHIYYDLNIVNNDTTGTKAPVKINFNEIRNSPIILNPEDYFVSVVRFKLETSYTLPAYVPQERRKQNSCNSYNRATVIRWRALYSRRVARFQKLDREADGKQIQPLDMEAIRERILG